MSFETLTIPQLEEKFLSLKEEKKIAEAAYQFAYTEYKRSKNSVTREAYSAALFNCARISVEIGKVALRIPELRRKEQGFLKPIALNFSFLSARLNA